MAYALENGLEYDEIDLDDLFFGNPPEMNEFKIVLKN